MGLSLKYMTKGSWNYEWQNYKLQNAKYDDDDHHDEQKVIHEEKPHFGWSNLFFSYPGYLASCLIITFDQRN